MVTKILLRSADAASWKVLKQSINIIYREECDTKNEEICDTIREEECQNVPQEECYTIEDEVCDSIEVSTIDLKG